MLGVLLTILKIILWVLLILVLFVLLLVLLVLFMPIRYQIDGSFHDSYAANAKVRYLGAGVRVGFSKENGLLYKIRFLGIPILSNQKKKKEKNRGKPPELFEDKTAAEIDEPVIVEEKPPEEPVLQQQNVEPQKEELPEKTQEKPILQQQNVEPQKEEPQKEEAKKEKPKKEPKKEKTKQEKPKKEPELTPQTETSVEDKKEDSSDSGDTEPKQGLLDKLADLKETVLTKKDHIVQLFEKPFTKWTLDRARKLLLKIGKCFFPKKAKGNLTLGLSNPADTGVTVGIISIFLPLYDGWLQIEPDFYHQVVEGDLWLKGKFRLAAIAFPALRIVLSRNFKRTLALAKKI